MDSKRELENQYLELHLAKLTVAAFEAWIYTAEGLEDAIGEDLYQELILLDYSGANIKSDLRKLLREHVDVDRYQREAFVAKLDTIIKKEVQMADLLIEMYSYYHRGYTFLEDLGVGIGLLLKILPVEYAAESYYDLSPSRQKKLLNRIHPVAKTLAEQVKAWINEQKIVLFQEEEFTVGKLQFSDYRTAIEKQSKIWEAHRDPETGEIIHKLNRLLDEQGHLISPEEMAAMLLSSGYKQQ
jgi:hypothetical protein